MAVFFLLLVFSMNLPFIMWGFGKVFTENIPSEINYIFGGRTRAYMQSKEAWKFAHEKCGSLWISWGKILAWTTLIIMSLVFFIGRSRLASAVCFTVIGQVIVMVITLLATERATENKFGQG